MANKTALITGGSTGIGFELAKCFAAHGHDLIIVARHRDALEAAAGKIEGKYGVRAAALAFDLADRESPQKLFDAIVADAVQIDFLVNNAGFGLHGDFADTDLERVTMACDEDDIVTVRCKTFRELESDSGGAAGDESRFVCHRN